MGGPSGNKTGKAAAPYLVGSSTSGVLEILLFHPIDTIAKRLMSNTTTIFESGGGSANFDRLSRVLFKDAYGKPLLTRYLSLFPGVSFGAAYKVLQRTYKFGSQPILRGYMTEKYGTQFTNAFGSNAKDMLNATSGALVGLGEIVLLPLDVLKIKSQTNPESLKGRGVVDIFVKENFKLYRGWTWTAARNMPGSFALFGANSVVYTRVFGVSGPKEATGFQIFVGSMSGGIASIVVSSPLDVIKTRIQNKAFDDPRSGFALVGSLMREEGMFAFWKGLTPKIGLIGPKLVFSFTVAQWLIAKLQDRWDTQ